MKRSVGGVEPISERSLTSWIEPSWGWRHRAQGPKFLLVKRNRMERTKMERTNFRLLLCSKTKNEPLKVTYLKLGIWIQKIAVNCQE